MSRQFGLQITSLNWMHLRGEKSAAKKINEIIAEYYKDKPLKADKGKPYTEKDAHHDELRKRYGTIKP